MMTTKSLLLAITAVITATTVHAASASIPRQVSQDVVIQCFPGAGGFDFSIRIIDSLKCATSAQLGEGFPNATAAELLSNEVPSCRAFAAADCTGLSTTFAHNSYGAGGRNCGKGWKLAVPLICEHAPESARDGKL
ncbi:hypothetical protein QBC35DRAFT_535574 [Podospora australis]|uniref:Ecp2 effector protein domain-containing protein n=1 Tax=Podospora australis TaxID=1536484 RepID=A0AAN7ADY2_9PEZI|nr:hypothetical protein QBC35DRAFT_535574 [Podospora australis]